MRSPSWCGQILLACQVGVAMVLDDPQKSCSFRVMKDDERWVMPERRDWLTGECFCVFQCLLVPACDLSTTILPHTHYHHLARGRSRNFKGGRVQPLTRDNLYWLKKKGGGPLDLPLLAIHHFLDTINLGTRPRPVLR
jgi:hypothetical protein